VGDQGPCLRHTLTTTSAAFRGECPQEC
jgi:hypothetical protein